MSADKSLAELANPDLDWFRETRFGMFIHWGLYALPARHEWVQSRERMTAERYQRYFDLFDPDLFHPTEWARLARQAGMKYFVITTKHHDGFCLWDTKQTDWKVTNTPYGRDIIAQVVDAFRAEGLRVGLYYSLIDWHHPDFVVENDPIHPMRDRSEWIEQQRGRNMPAYAAYMRAQIRELLTQYGTIDYLFYDFSYPHRAGPLKGRQGWESEELLRLTRELQPRIIVNDRLDLLDVPGGWDFKTPEQFLMRQWPEVDGCRVPWETTHTFSGSWGYYRDEFSWKSVKQLLTILIDTVSKGGNLVLNIGPTARGTIDPRAVERLQGIGEWMRLHGRAIYGCTQAPDGFTPPEDSRLTYNPRMRRLYVHLLNWPFRHLHLDGFAGKVKYAQLLNDGSEIGFSHHREADHHAHQQPLPEDTLTLDLPAVAPPVEVPVIELFLQ